MALAFVPATGIGGNVPPSRSTWRPSGSCHSSPRVTATVALLAGGKLSLVGLRQLQRRLLRRRGLKVASYAARVEASSSATFFQGSELPSPSKSSRHFSVAGSLPGAPPPGSQVLPELQFLITNPMEHRLAVTAVATVELRSSVEVVWQALTGAEEGIEKTWLKLQLTDCYGLPPGLSLMRLWSRGELQVGMEVVGDLAIFDSVARKFRWSVEELSLDRGSGWLRLKGSIDGEEGTFYHAISVEPQEGEFATRVRSELLYAPQPPVQTLLNAAGGRNSVKDANANFLRRLGVLLDGDVDFDSNRFYDFIGQGTDNLAYFEDGAREVLTRKLLGGTSGLQLLEVGCGTGRWAAGLLAEQSTAVGRYLGIESSSTMANAAASSLGGSNNAAVLLADARKPGTLAQASTTFLKGPPDRIAMNYVLDLLDDVDAKGLLLQCRELLLSSKGKLGICCICPGTTFMSAWETVWRSAPGIVGGCQPKDMRGRLQLWGWQVESSEEVEVLGYVSQVIIASPSV